MTSEPTTHQETTFDSSWVDLPASQQRLGQLLLQLELITEEQLQLGLAEQQRTGSKIGEILVASGFLHQEDLQVVLSEQLDIQRVDVSGFVPEQEIIDLLPRTVVELIRAAPVALKENVVMVVVDRELTTEQLSALAAHLPGKQVKQLISTPTALDLLLQRMYGSAYSHEAKYALQDLRPNDSAHKVLSTGQAIFFSILLAVIVIGFIFATSLTAIILVGLCSLFYLMVSVYKLHLIYKSLGHQYEVRISDAEVAALDEKDLPMYTILVPLYKEAAVIPALVEGIGSLDYPKTKLDVKLLCEEDDDETVQAILDLNLPPHFKLVVVPDSQPKTKPKACNYGLFQAEGEYIVIFDAEDRPDIHQLKKSVIAFRKAPDDVTCIQAKLNYFNQDQNILTRWFSAEYSMHFDLVLPGLDADNVPIPLGGTSNHFMTNRLKELGAWDPFNVTEDADLGIRLHKAGYSTAVMDSTTLEEANSNVANWIRQRSRWIKGYIQTWLVHMRNPLRLLNEVGLKDFISFNLVVGGVFVFLLNPIFWFLTTLYIVTQAGFIQDLFPAFIFYVASAMLFVGNFIFVYLNLAGCMQRGYFGLVKYALLSPIYWGLMSWAAWKGAIQLVTNPFYWEKTEHGLDNTTKQQTKTTVNTKEGTNS